ncbi:tRNA1(Val) (adenine(37)-N6)-methyltransferase [Flavivirga sp. 57AJ16]|uniref:tRNA1(Val) (adenine(37)-N6)-methyltransferase n=1 Tax=Flavivirga sp. 57AJ16 TaxID=3025307 RepID=UPI00236683A3|nr:methyltransferase [Flavivirga sp. 57AJ16]MDD7884522.1 methyltransferase [Flavivirga sp. 57AJ16]
MSKNPFIFKQFSVNQEQCAMKIGTDGVLLGAWTSIKEQPFSILDIGAGTGILSLMLAQRSHAEIIDAIEIDDRAYEQCVDNFERSPWGDRLFCYHAALEEFVDEIDDTYDLIICNPPFFSPSLASPASSEEDTLMSNARKTARFYDAMPFGHLIESVSKLLSENGIFSVIIPFKEEKTLIDLASNFKLTPKRILHIKGTPSSKIKRSLIEFSFCAVPSNTQESDLKVNCLIIETSRHLYTKDYINLTKDFYLKM